LRLRKSERAGSPRRQVNSDKTVLPDDDNQPGWSAGFLGKQFNLFEEPLIYS